MNQYLLPVENANYNFYRSPNREIHETKETSSTTNELNLSARIKFFEQKSATKKGSNSPALTPNWDRRKTICVRSKSPNIPVQDFKNIQDKTFKESSQPSQIGNNKNSTNMEYANHIETDKDDRTFHDIDYANKTAIKTDSQPKLILSNCDSPKMELDALENLTFVKLTIPERPKMMRRSYTRPKSLYNNTIEHKTEESIFNCDLSNMIDIKGVSKTPKLSPQPTGFVRSYSLMPGPQKSRLRKSISGHLLAPEAVNALNSKEDFTNVVLRKTNRAH